MARKPRLWSRKSFKPLKADGKRDKAERFVVTRGTDKGSIISKAAMITRTQGAHPSKLAAERKANPFAAYKTAATREQARKQREKRQPFTRPDWKNPSKVTGGHTFLNKAGVQQTEQFRGHWLAVMQGYRDASFVVMVHGADGANLKQYDRMKIKTASGERVHPETDAKKLRAYWAGLSERQRNEFEREIYYLKEKEQRMVA